MINTENISIISTQLNESLSSSSSLIPYSIDTDLPTTYNIMQEDNLIELIKQKFTEDDMEIFKMNFKIYLANEDNKNGFVVDLDDIYRYIGFKQKGHAKRFLINKFTINIHYIISLSPTGKRSSETTRGGENYENIMLNIETFKKFCMKASTKESEKFLDYYITMENVIFDYIKIKMTEQLKINFENKKILELKDKQLEEKENELKNIKNLKYEEIHKSEYIYVF